MRGWVRVFAMSGCVALTLTAGAADSAPGDTSADPYADLRGLLLDVADLQPRTVVITRR